MSLKIIMSLFPSEWFPPSPQTLLKFVSQLSNLYNYLYHICVRQGLIIDKMLHKLVQNPILPVSKIQKLSDLIMTNVLPVN